MMIKKGLRNFIYGFAAGYWASIVWGWLMEVPEKDE